MERSFWALREFPPGRGSQPATGSIKEVLRRETDQEGTQAGSNKGWQRGRSHVEGTGGWSLSCGSPRLRGEGVNSHVLGMNISMAGKNRQN